MLKRLRETKSKISDAIKRNPQNVIYVTGIITGGGLVGVGMIVTLRAKNQVISDIGSYLKLKDPVLLSEMTEFLDDKYSKLW